MTHINVLITISRKRLWRNKNTLVIDAVTKTMQKIAVLRRKLVDNVCTISVLLSDDNQLHKMNLKYRNKDKATNVLSFQNIDWSKEVVDILSFEQIDCGKNTNIYEVNANYIIPKKSCEIKGDTMVVHLGDIMVSYERVEKESKEQNRDFDDYLSFMIVHGTLHLMGYDHEEEDEAHEMAALERSIMSSLNSIHGIKY